MSTLSDGTTAVYNLGDIAWSESQCMAATTAISWLTTAPPVVTAMALVWIMIPGVGLFYSGLLRRKNALSMIFLSMAGVGVGSFQWFFWGYSLAFADNASA